MLRLIAFSCVLVSQLTPTTVSQHSCRITVVDLVGAPIAGARVLVSPNTMDRSMTAENVMQTDHNGHLTAPVSDGILDVCALSSGFAPVCKQAQVKGKDVDLRFKLRFSKFMEMVE